jgi:hypothetical protein
LTVPFARLEMHSVGNGARRHTYSVMVIPLWLQILSSSEKVGKSVSFEFGFSRRPVTLRNISGDLSHGSSQFFLTTRFGSQFSSFGLMPPFFLMI